ncbi:MULTISPECIES: bacterioferritin [Pseudoalteromonas]|uniref:Bacterioferritin n=1 Tax=Pseudoalteromonas rubra TaxID=43658 RepID=A0A0L0EU52_9GAMM|nr:MULTISPECIES: bacterioferritin [Pseudoalteromonas]ALU45343.1 bacterioferritin [Pseudoalteromonas rubra]KAF7781687.1 bacterioferritin [Pseudoalteromonas rubra]KNC68007.1 bacterioferritin [Pseudoalteromonas rubra]MCG7534243.1 bacterioferritin [Pseudoalteromonas sp. OOF1S-7]MCG7560284.1 bacterioferritin [Pseudoalteromonas sp. McH1-42]
MQGSKQVIAALNQVLTLELTSINQYFLHARMWKNWGIEELNEKAYKKSIKDMKQADDLIERILFLEGLPNLQHLEKLRIGEHTEEMLSCDMAFEMEQLPVLRSAIELCEKEQDYVSRELLEDILEYEEDYVDWLETQQFLIKNCGIENYLQSQIEE